MAEGTQVRDHTVSAAENRPPAAALDSLGAKIRRAVAHTFFWAYERGTWQYDLIVIAILAFIFLTPRSWFDDRPTLQMTDLRHAQGIVEISQSKDGRTYLVDARLVESMGPAKPEEAIRSIVGARVQRPFVVKSVDPVRDRHHVVLGYTVGIIFQ